MKFSGKSSAIFYLFTVVLATGCSTNTQGNNTPKSPQKVDDAYLDDAVTAVADDSQSDTKADDSLHQSVSGTALDAMVDKRFAELDTDKSGTISEQEFLSRAKSNGAIQGTQSAQEQQRRESRLVALMEKFAGSDKELSRDELKAMLTSQESRVSGHRHRRGGSSASTSQSSVSDPAQQPQTQTTSDSQISSDSSSREDKRCQGGGGQGRGSRD